MSDSVNSADDDALEIRIRNIISKIDQEKAGGRSDCQFDFAAAHQRIQAAMAASISSLFPQPQPTGGLLH